jgi:exopolysaccharide biosynthesis polyprenyl glycosylphosphotransferase
MACNRDTASGGVRFSRAARQGALLNRDSSKTHRQPRAGYRVADPHRQPRVDYQLAERIDLDFLGGPGAADTAQPALFPPASPRTVPAAAGAPDREPGARVAHGRRTFAGDSRGFVLRRRLALSDLLGLTLAGAAAVGVATALGEGSIGLGTVAAFVICLPLWLVIANTVGLYHLSDRRLGPSAADEVGPILFALALWSWCLLLLEALLDRAAPELLLAAVLWVAGFAAILGLRALTRAIARRRPWYEQRVAILGNPVDVRRVVRRLERHPELGLKVACVGEISDDPLRTRDGAEITDLVERSEINRVIVASFPGDLEERSGLIRALSEHRVHIDVVSADADAIPPHGMLHYMEGLPVLTIAAVREPRSRAIFKRSFDLFAAGTGLVLLSPLLAYCAIRIRLESPGRALFRQVRVGRDGEPFQVLKFRTMIANAEGRKEELAAMNLHAGAPGMFKVANDPRTTRFGAWLRRWSIDELPQLVNVLKGDMSLVGPRPLIPEEARLIQGHHEVRLTARPGITGPWQTLGRSDIGFEDMIKLDYAYVMNPSFAEDMKLLMRTVNAVLAQRGAY